jgi:hypothetical protein
LIVISPRPSLLPLLLPLPLPLPLLLPLPPLLLLRCCCR